MINHRGYSRRGCTSDERVSILSALRQSPALQREGVAISSWELRPELPELWYQCHQRLEIKILVRTSL